ncbi:hypothetical protein [Acinetobacter sp. CWB-B33]
MLVIAGGSGNTEQAKSEFQRRHLMRRFKTPNKMNKMSRSAVRV